MREEPTKEDKLPKELKELLDTDWLLPQHCEVKPKIVAVHAPHNGSQLVISWVVVNGFPPIVRPARSDNPYSYNFKLELEGYVDHTFVRPSGESLTLQLSPRPAVPGQGVSLSGREKRSKEEKLLLIQQRAQLKDEKGKIIKTWYLPRVMILHLEKK
jgi:hypothetical protein